MKLEIAILKKDFKDETLNEVKQYLNRYGIKIAGSKGNLKEDKLYIDTERVEFVEKLPDIFSCKVKVM